MPELVSLPRTRVRGDKLLERLHRGMLRLDRLVDKCAPEPLNPMGHTGAIATTSFLVATVTGFLLLVWYRPSAHQAYDSVAAMAPYSLSGFMRALHRYSSDACMFFALLHALRLFFARRFTGARWLAWVSGIGLVAILWFVGWTGYWLVWDQPAQQVAVGSARLVEGLPIFAEPLSRSFLTDDSVNSLLFFMVFFLHMLVPLLLGLLLWIHIMRLSRPRFLTGTVMSAWVVGSLMVMSWVFPAHLAEPARMLIRPQGFLIDAWYLWPLVLTDRLMGGVLWGIFFVSSAMLGAVPWLFRKGSERAKATVREKSCNACGSCVADCPYTAISMAPRTDGRNHPGVARVDPALCVACGICAGSCNSAGIQLAYLPTLPLRRALDDKLASQSQLGVAFVCEHSASSPLEGYHTVTLPCISWVNPHQIERALRRGAARVLMVGCKETSCHYREGTVWTDERLRGQREPMLKQQFQHHPRIQWLKVDATQRALLRRKAAAFLRKDGAPKAVRLGPRWQRIGLAAALASVFSGVVWLGSELPYRLPMHTQGELVVSFNHPGQRQSECRERSQEELQKLPAHMRVPTVCERSRAAVRMEVHIDDKMVHAGKYLPQGIAADGNSIALERFSVPQGSHNVWIRIADANEVDVWTYEAKETLRFEANRRRVVLFDKEREFQWH